MNVTMGISQGVLPFIGYNYGAKRFDRVHQANKFARTVAVCFSASLHYYLRDFCGAYC